MTEPFDEYGERLRRVLHAEAEAVTPSPEGLEQIRGKISKKRERRFGAWFAIPWLRPLAAVAAAIVVAGAAVSATPALKTFVQTGHFSPEDRQDGGTSVAGGQHAVTAAPPVNPSHSGMSAAPHPTWAPTTPSGAHVITGRKCPPGEDPIKPPPGSTDGQTASVSPSPQVTCRPDTVTSPPTSQAASPPPVTSPTQQTPTSEAPTNGAQQPSTQSSP
ncbi:hypothetical protein NE236_15185 [Actinoallomurus purpureus]|uniref:hypothetical protein n=1 Tax=Actinoallomurus purpureus TaxID=478114 RepID=UPI002092058B|nr:hypothetical protein [Actinoallomurus purpureus]MCO6006334.1 hypothetical protein [Actinoallomurus purpureus]